MSNPITDKRNMALVKDLRAKSKLSLLDRYRHMRGQKELEKVDEKGLKMLIQKERWRFLFEQGKKQK